MGSGRIIFSLNFTEAEFQSVSDRFVRAAESMRQEGWWAPVPGLGNKSIRRQILKEMLARWGGTSEVPCKRSPSGAESA